ncbi:hypothetical protein B0H14DRAFT_3472555 [Mycena olivaceomarginata]|nr:hypothetical protein B0H14DRAFT_3472555 [Mycena olivaceomarginata]
MKRSNNGTQSKKKRAKNTFSLASFGHSLKPSNAVRAGKLTADGRRADIRVVPIQCERTPVPPSPAPEDEWVDMQVDDEPPADSRPPRKRKWYATTDDNLRHWVANYRDEYLRSAGELSVAAIASVLRCFCRDCLLEGHRLRPLCRIEAWNGTFFDRQDLRQLGLRVQLGHSDNRPCAHAHPGGRISWSSRRTATTPLQLTIVNVDAVAPSLTGSNFSPTAALPRRQPSREKRPAYHFFNALAKLTDNTGGTTFKCRYQLALQVVRQWRNLRALKRGGMGNDPDRRTAETHEGELAVECLACPKAGVNLPEGWEKAPVEVRFLYCIFLAIDACFRLKRKKIFQLFVETLGEQKEMSTCTSLAALDHANTKYAQGYAATGCGMITCGRHEIVCKNGVGDLQAGEKYGNMDYIVASAWRHLRNLLFFLLSYDIMCQWMKNLCERLLKLPPALRSQLAHYFVKFVIPKLHILGHPQILPRFLFVALHPGLRASRHGRNREDLVL